MKPTLLKITAFGPFSDIQTIDFSTLGQHSLFLINGPTGAGKSAILDALCFALYGQTTHPERDATMLRSHHAKATLLTEVLLEFCYGDDYYRIERSPTQLKPKSKGQGFTEYKTQGTLWKIDEKGTIVKVMVAKKASDVTAEITHLLGINVDQFRQVMILPQGKFRQLLLADSKEREQIFSQLFQTHYYQKIEKSLKQKSADIIQQSKAIKDKIQGILSTVNLTEPSQLDVEIDLLKPILAQAKKHKDSTQTALHTCNTGYQVAQVLVTEFQQLDYLNQELKTINALTQDINSKRLKVAKDDTAQKIKPFYLDLERAQQQIKSTEQSLSYITENLKENAQLLAQRETAFDHAKQSFDTLDQEKSQLFDLIRQKPQLLALDNARKSQAEDQKRFEQFSAQLTTQESLVVKTQSMIDTITPKIKTLKDQCETIHEIQSQWDQAQANYELRKKLDSLVVQKNNYIDEQKKLTTSFNQIQTMLEQQLQQTKLLELTWHQQQAYFLAQQLKPNTPCPVCGNTSHPNTAKLLADQKMVQKKDIEYSQQQVDTLNNDYHALNKKISVIETSHRHVQTCIEDLHQQLDENIEHQQTHWQNKLATLRQTLESLQQAQTELTEHQSRYNQLINTLAAQKNEGDKIKSTLQSAKEKWIISDQTVLNLEQSIQAPFKTMDEFDAKIAVHQKNISTIEQQFEQSQAQLAVARKSHIQLTTQFEEKNHELLGHKHFFQQCDQTFKEALKSAQLADLEAFQQILLNSDQRTQLDHDIQKFDKRLLTTQTQQQQQAQRLVGKDRPDLDALSAQLTESQRLYDLALKHCQDQELRYQQLSEIKKKLLMAKKQEEQLQQSFEVFGTLSQVANGEIGMRISLQRFVLGVLLDDVLIEASRRLQLMSKGRYTLIRSGEQSKGRKAGGLELLVEDAYTGQARPVATLSGGESFLSALSLALGLSDVVQAYAGGIKAQTLFIDEGFGSLDQEALDLAIRTLVDLQSSGRMVGIISHVSELKEQISQRIDISSSLTGSQISIHQ